MDNRPNRPLGRFSRDMRTLKGTSNSQEMQICSAVRGTLKILFLLRGVDFLPFGLIQCMNTTDQIHLLPGILEED